MFANIIILQEHRWAEHNTPEGILEISSNTRKQRLALTFEIAVQFLNTTYRNIMKIIYTMYNKKCLLTNFKYSQ